MSARLARLDADDAQLGAGLHPDAVLLSRMFFDPAGDGRALADRLVPAEFPRAGFRALYGAFVAALAAHRDGITTSALTEYVRSHAPACVPMLHAVMPVPFSEYEDGHGAPIALGDHVAQFRDWSRRTRLGWTLEYVAMRAADEGMTAPQVEALVEQRLAAYRAGTRSDRVFDDAHAQTAEALAYLDADRAAGLPFGFAPLDAAAFPLQAGQFVVVGGTPGAGKSTVVRNLGMGWLVRGTPLAGLSVEMSGAEWRTALVCAQARLPLERYTKQAFTAAERAEFAAGLEALRDAPHFVLNEQGRLTPPDVLRAFARYRADFAERFPDRVPVLALDHFHRVDFGADEGGGGSRDGGGALRHAMGGFARDLKTFAKDHECIVVAAAQYKKLAPNEEPDDSKFRESNGLAEEADKIFHVFRPLVAHQPGTDGALWPLLDARGGPLMGDAAPDGAVLAPDDTAVYVKLGKQRAGGRSGIVRIPFDAATGRMGADAPALTRPRYAQPELVA